MQLGVVGLGRMGANIVRRLQRAGHECVVYDVNAGAVARELGGARAPPAPASTRRLRRQADPAPGGLGDGAGRLRRAPPSSDVAPALRRRRLDHRRRQLLLPRRHRPGRGAGGARHPLRRRRHLRRRLRPRARLLPDDRRRGRAGPAPRPRSSRRWRPGSATRARTTGREGEPSPAEQGWLHCGPNGAGHFVKMVHNGIEYGLMAAYAEGLNILHRANVGLQARTRATPRPRRCASREYYQLRHRPRPGRRGLAAGLGRGVVAARPDGRRPRRRPRPRRLLGPGLRLGRGPLDACWPPSTRGRPPTCCPPRCSTASPPRAQADYADKVLVGHAQAVRRPPRSASCGAPADDRRDARVGGAAAPTTPASPGATCATCSPTTASGASDWWSEAATSASTTPSTASPTRRCACSSPWPSGPG